MAFENVDVSSLKNALIRCKHSINHSTTDELINNISNTSIWQTSAQKKIKDALITLSNERYKELESKIDSYINVVSYIDKYQELQKENEQLKKQHSNLSNKLYYSENYNTTADTYSENVENKKIENQMFDIQTKINNNKEEMERLKNKVLNSY